MNVAAENIKPGIIHITPTLGKKTYGVIITFDEQKKIHFKQEVTNIQALDGERFIFGINREQVYIDNKAPDLIVDKLADALGKYLYPVHLIVDAQGYVIDIYHHEELVYNWEQHKHKTEQYFRGAIAANIIQQMDRKVRNKGVLLNALKQDWFMSLFFSGIYGLKPYDFRNTTKLLLPVQPFAAAIKYQITREITQQHSRNKCFRIECKGNIATQGNNADAKDNMSAQEAIAQEGTVTLKYLLYHSDYSIRSIVCGCELFTDKQKKKVMVEIYDLDKNKNIA